MHEADHQSYRYGGSFGREDSGEKVMHGIGLLGQASRQEGKVTFLDKQ